MSKTKLKNKEIFMKKVLEISEEKIDFEIAKKEFSYWGQIKPKEEMKSPLFDDPNKTIKWGILFYNEKTNTPFVCSSKSQYYMREKTRVFKGIKQKADGNGSSKKPINKLFINKLSIIFKKIIIKPFEKITDDDVRKIKMIKYILEEIELDIKCKDFVPFYRTVVKAYIQFIDWGFLLNKF